MGRAAHFPGLPHIKCDVDTDGPRTKKAPALDPAGGPVPRHGASSQKKGAQGQGWQSFLALPWPYLSLRARRDLSLASGGLS